MKAIAKACKPLVAALRVLRREKKIARRVVFERILLLRKLKLDIKSDMRSAKLNLKKDKKNQELIDNIDTLTKKFEVARKTLVDEENEEIRVKKVYWGLMAGDEHKMFGTAFPYPTT